MVMSKDRDRIRIRMDAYDHEVLDKAALSIVEAAKRTGALVHGPIPLPTRIERYTVIRSPHANKTSREQFEMRTHKRVIELTEASAKTMDALTRITMSPGVSVRINTRIKA
jgi:small subunit ribosomal protein S10